METLDCRTLQCPHPVVEVRKRLLARPGEPLAVLVGDETARENVTRLGRSLGFRVGADPAAGGGYTLTLTPGEAAGEVSLGAPASGKTVVFVASDAMGNGSDELGRLLLKNFLFTLIELDPVPDVILFVNAGVRLTTTGSEALEALQKLADFGADIASCGLCLDYFHLKDRLAIGRVTTMLDIVENLRQAGRTLRP